MCMTVCVAANLLRSVPQNWPLALHIQQARDNGCMCVCVCTVPYWSVASMQATTLSFGMDQLLHCRRANLDQMAPLRESKPGEISQGTTPDTLNI